MVHATVRVYYDLKQLETRLDTVGKIVYLLKVPFPEIDINPTVQYFDFQQRSFNEFNTEDLNRIHTKCIQNITKSIDL